MDDFIFGTLATDDLRLGHIRSLRSGVTHHYRRLPRDPKAGEAVALELTVGPANFQGLQALDRAWIYWSADGELPEGKLGKALQGQVIEMEKTQVEWDTLLWGYVQHFRGIIPGQPAGTVVRYRISAGDPAGAEVFADNGKGYGYYVDDDPAPEWASQAVVYQVFADRFNPGGGRPWKRPRRPSGFYGGTLPGIAEKLDYILGLGANTLWLSPIFPSPSHHGYDATSYFDIEPRLGSKADFRMLVDNAHQAGLKILMDLAPNHWSSMHPTFQEAIKSEDSPFRSWYSFKQWPEEYESFFGVKELPKLNLLDPAARQHMLDAAAYWLDFGVDGFRVDHAIGPTPDFWADFRKVTRAHKPDCWTFGEVVDPPDLQLAFEGLLDGCLDFILLEAIRQTFAFGRWQPDQFTSFLDRHEAHFPRSFSRPSFLDNHDMNRFLWAARGDLRRLRLAAMCQFTLSGPPVIYQGTEVGLSQERDVRQGRRGIPEESRLPMLWDGEQDQALLDYYKDLIMLRKNNPVLVHGSRETFFTGQNVLAYARGHEEGDLRARRVAVVINLDNGPQTCRLPGLWKTTALETGPGSTVLKTTRETTEVSLAALSGVVLYDA